MIVTYLITETGPMVTFVLPRMPCPRTYIDLDSATASGESFTYQNCNSNTAQGVLLLTAF